MRVDVKKYLVIGPTSQRETFFQAMQKAGIAEFISKEHPSQEVPHEIRTFIDALHILHAMTPVKQVRPLVDYRTASVVAQDIIEKHGRLEHLREQKRVLEKESARIEPFGFFSKERLEALEGEMGRTVQFFFTKKGTENEATGQENVIYINSAYGMDYYISISKEPKSLDGLVEMHIEASLGELHEQLAQVQREIDNFEMSIARLAHHEKLLKAGLTEALNSHHLKESEEKTRSHLDGELFAVEAWVPKNKLATLEAIAEAEHVFTTQIQIEEDDRIPTYLENQGFGRLGEDLINIYDTPSKSDRDPSLWVFLAFGLFFSMIVADAGYGLILLGISLYLLFKFGKKKGLGRRVIFLSISLSVGCIIWGVMATSFLGIEFAPDNPVRDVSLIHWMVKKKTAYIIEHKGAAYDEWIKEFPKLENIKEPMTFLMSAVKKQDKKVKYVVYDRFSDNVMMELVIFIGTIHIMLSFLRYLDKNWAALGWVLFMVGSYLYFPSILKALSLIHYIFGVPPVFGAEIGRYLLFCGLGLAWLLSIIQNRLGGLVEIMHVIGVFADVMSYLRIYALSLAGMIMASTFDQIGTEAPFYVGILIILGGHTVNFTLTLMGGVIHGLRLNFIEWYHYSFEGGGRHFNPLKLIGS